MRAPDDAGAGALESVLLLGGAAGFAANPGKLLGSVAARPFATTVMPESKGGGRALRLASRPQALAPPQVNEHLGFSHFPGLHFHVHCGSLHLLSQFSAQSVWHLGGEHTVLHAGQPPCAQACSGQTMAQVGASQRCRQDAVLIGPHAVSHWGGAQTGWHTSSQAALPQFQKHCGWQPPPGTAS